MLFSSWLRNWKRSAPASRRGIQTSVRQRPSFRPRLEALEDRTLPSGGGLHVTHSSHGHGGGSGGGLPYATAATTSQLIADINYANKAGGTVTINLAPNTTFDLRKANNTIPPGSPEYGANGLPVIGGTNAIDLTILGNGDTIERVGSNAFRLFDVAPGASLSLEDVTLQGGGGDDYGGAIFNQGTLKVSNSTLSGNSAGAGGGIANNGGTVAINNSTLSGNSAFYGGGIANNDGTVTVSTSKLTGNSAMTYTSVIYPGGHLTFAGMGGGIYNAVGTLTISNSTLSDNHAVTGGGGGFTYGGGIYNRSGTVKVSNSSTLSGNSASEGGGIYNYAGTLTISNSVLSGNYAYYGGGIYIAGGTVSVSGCSFTNNSAQKFKTPITTGNGNTYDGGKGGGIFVYAGTLTVQNSDFENNSPDNIDNIDGNIDSQYSGNGNTGLS